MTCLTTYIHTYIYIVNTWSKSCLLGSQYLVQVSEGVPSVFQKIVGMCQKWGFRKENGFFVLAFCCCWGKTNTKEAKQQKKKEYCKNAQKNCVWGRVGKVESSKNGFLRKIAKQDLCLERGKGHFHQHYLFWQNCPFACSSQKAENTTKIVISVGTMHNWENRMGGFSNNRFVLKPDVAIASEVSIWSKNSLAITDFHGKKTQHVQLFENPLPGTPIRDSQHNPKIAFFDEKGVFGRGL